MSNTVDFTSFQSWQISAQKLFEQAKATETAVLEEKYKDAIAAQAEKQTALKRLVDGFTEFCESKPSDRAEIADEETLAAYCTATAKMERIANQFDLRWRRQYEYYVLDMAALEKEYKRVLRLLRSPKSYEAAKRRHAKQLANADSEGGATNA